MDLDLMSKSLVTKLQIEQLLWICFAALLQVVTSHYSVLVKMTIGLHHAIGKSTFAKQKMSRFAT